MELPATDDTSDSERIRELQAENERLRKQLDEVSLRSIEARNPGIDMDEVCRMRARDRMLADVDAADEDD